MKSLLGVALLGVVLGACSGEVATTKLESVDLAEYKTYALLPPNDTSASWINDQQRFENIMDAISMRMEEMGYTLSTTDPDLLVLVHTNSNNYHDVSVYPSNYPYYEVTDYRGYWYDYFYSDYDGVQYIYGPRVSAVEYTEGTLIIDVIGADEREILWRGAAHETERPDGDMHSEMVENVSDIFSEYPEEPRS